MTTVHPSQAASAESVSTAVQIDWVNIIKQWKSSGMSQPAYCKVNHINYNQFIYQCGKLSARAKIESKLLPVKISQPDFATAIQNNFVLIYPSGLKCQIPVNAHPDAIKTILTCLETR